MKCGLLASTVCIQFKESIFIAIYIKLNMYKIFVVDPFLRNLYKRLATKIKDQTQGQGM
jgi:hypothetical protein